MVNVRGTRISYNKNERFLKISMEITITFVGQPGLLQDESFNGRCCL